LRPGRSSAMCSSGKCFRIRSHCWSLSRIIRHLYGSQPANNFEIGSSKWRMCVRPAVSVQSMATPPMTHGGHAAMRGKSMKCSASAAAASFCDRRDVGRDTKRAHRNACRQNADRSLFHGTSPTRSSKAVGVTPSATHRTDLALANI